VSEKRLLIADTEERKTWRGSAQEASVHGMGGTQPPRPREEETKNLGPLKRHGPHAFCAVPTPFCPPSSGVTQQLFVCARPEIFQAPLTGVDMLLLLITKYKQVSVRTRIDGGTTYELAKGRRGGGCLLAGLHSAEPSQRLHPRRGTDLVRLYSSSRREKQRNGQESECPLRTPRVSHMSGFCILLLTGGVPTKVKRSHLLCSGLFHQPESNAVERKNTMLTTSSVVSQL